MNIPCILIAIISCTAMNTVRSQMPSIPMPPVPMPPIPMPSMPPLPMLHEDDRVRRSAQVPQSPMSLEQWNLPSALAESQPTPLVQRNRRNTQTESIPAPLEQRKRRSASSTHFTADFQATNIVGNVEPEVFGIRGRREARGGGRLPTKKG